MLVSPPLQFEKTENGKGKIEKCGGYCHPRATMQKNEKKGVAGGATCNSLKAKAQICRGH
jgi:hypothetical protein